MIYMEMVELSVKIPKECKEFIDNGIKISWVDAIAIISGIANGTVLQKGHGRLIDADKLKTHFIDTEQGTDLEVYLESTIIEAPTIIEADKEESED